MDFLKPTYLYLLFLIPLLLLLYVLKLRRKTYVVSSSLLWEQAIEDMKANTPFQRLRRNLLLPLQIIFLMLAIFALARPFWRGTADATQNTILIIDGSASMKATDGGGIRFEAAKSIAAKMVDDLSDGDKMMIVEAASAIRIVSSFTADKLQLRNKLAKMQSTDAPTELGRAIQLASSMAKDAQNSEIILLSDGAGGESLLSAHADALNHASVSARFIRFGEKVVNNVGITAFEMGQSLTDASERQAFVALRNFGAVERQSLLLEFYHNENLVDVRELNLSSGERRSVIFDATGCVEGYAKVVLDIADDLDVDDRAYYMLAEYDALKTLLVSSGNRFLEAAVETGSDRIELFTEKPEMYSANEKYDVIVFDGFVPDDLPDKNMLFVNPGLDLPFGEPISRSDAPAVIDWDRTHPIMWFVELSNLKIRSNHNYKMPTWMKPLVESDTGTLVWLGEHDGRRVVVLSFESRFHSANNFPMLTAFPIFVSNTLNWLAGIDTEFSRGQVKTGEPLRLSRTAIDQAVTVKKPDGSQVELRSKGGRIVFGDTGMVGIYEVTGEGFAEKFAVSLLNESESDIKPADRIQIAGREVASSAAFAVSNKEIWSSLTLVALILLAIEWWVYHRRVLV